MIVALVFVQSCTKSERGSSDPAAVSSPVPTTAPRSDSSTKTTQGEDVEIDDVKIRFQFESVIKANVAVSPSECTFPDSSSFAVRGSARDVRIWSEEPMVLLNTRVTVKIDPSLITDISKIAVVYRNLSTDAEKCKSLLNDSDKILLSSSI
jgi:hypothetical protein